MELSWKWIIRSFALKKLCVKKRKPACLHWLKVISEYVFPPCPSNRVGQRCQTPFLREPHWGFSACPEWGWHDLSLRLFWNFHFIGPNRSSPYSEWSHLVGEVILQKMDPLFPRRLFHNVSFQGKVLLGHSVSGDNVITQFDHYQNCCSSWVRGLKWAQQ